MSLPEIPRITGWAKWDDRWYRRIRGIIHCIRSHRDKGLYENVAVDQLIDGEWKTIFKKPSSKPYDSTKDDVFACVKFAEFLGDLE
jgi:hypothetical protein